MKTDVIEKPIEEVLETDTTLKTKRGDLLSIDPRNIVHNEDKNVRHEYGNIDELMESLVHGGQRDPIIVSKIAGTDKYEVIDGFRRMRAIEKALSMGYDFPYVKAIVGSGNEEDRLFAALITGTTKLPLTMLEEGETYQRLKDFGYEVKEIAQKVGKTQVHVYDCLKLADVPKHVKNRIIADKISSRTVLAMLKENKNPEELTSAVENAITIAEKEHVETGKKAKATNRHTGKISAMKTLEKALELVDPATHTNADLLKKVFNGLKKGVKPETIANYFA